MAMKVDWRGNFTELYMNGTLRLRIETKLIPELIQQLLAIPPLKELKDSRPLVIYFGNDADREEFMAVLQSVKKNMRMVKV